VLTLNNDRMNAFYQVAIDKNFNKAAMNLCITQPALSQRIQKLEQELQATLLVRNNTGIELTNMGQRLFDYARNNIALEQGLLTDFSGNKNETFGSLRIAAYSSILRSVIMPSIEPLVRKYPLIHVEFYSREIRELIPMLKSGEADLIILNHLDDDAKLVNELLGEETLVHIRPNSGINKETDYENTIFLDHDTEDTTTYDFFNQQELGHVVLKRRFYDDVYGIIDGVSLGLGDAIASKHLVKNYPNVQQIEHKYDVNEPVYLYWIQNIHHSPIQREAIDCLMKNVKGYL